MYRIYPQRIKGHYNSWKKLLNKQGIRTEDAIDRTYGITEGNDLVATASVFKNIIKCVAIDTDHKGGSIFNELLSPVIKSIYDSGYNSMYVYTKPDAAAGFESIGFKEIERVDDKLVFMERASNGLNTFLSNLKSEYKEGNTIGSIVLNANPFTNGHLYLIETAANQCDILHLFVVSEEMSVFSNDIRKKLVVEGTQHLNNVYVHDTGPYIVSAATFPSYFLKDDEDVIKVQATLDSKIFKYHIARSLGITDRYVGSEPFSRATDIYNKAIERTFKNSPYPNYPKLHIIERLKLDDTVVSASVVRNIIATDTIDKVSNLVPKSTFDFLKSDEAKSYIEMLRLDENKGFKDSDI